MEFVHNGFGYFVQFLSMGGFKLLGKFDKAVQQLGAVVEILGPLPKHPKFWVRETKKFRIPVSCLRKHIDRDACVGRRKTRAVKVDIERRILRSVRLLVKRSLQFIESVG